jgi:hypothetical protein
LKTLEKTLGAHGVEILIFPRVFTLEI